ncbi:hypothetical protein AB0M79_16655 [Polymorphospora sp. NPDC051019]|uniref:hypothetical protein n=1 Tax=Polymorphospora sp. NPDC051019 TaxID=3155725 RepID=UPI003434EF4D
MGWNTTAIFAAGWTTDRLLELAPDDLRHRPTGELVGLDEAGSAFPGGRLYVREDAGWAQLWDPELRVMPFAPEPGRDGLAAPGTRVVGVIFASVSSTYGFWYVEDGKLVRQIVFQDGEPVQDDGEPLPVESGIEFPEWGPDEDFVFAVIRAVTGFEPDDEPRYAVHEVD